MNYKNSKIPKSFWQWICYLINSEKLLPTKVINKIYEKKNRRKSSKSLVASLHKLATGEYEMTKYSLKSMLTIKKYAKYFEEYQIELYSRSKGIPLQVQELAWEDEDFLRFLILLSYLSENDRRKISINGIKLCKKLLNELPLIDYIDF